MQKNNGIGRVRSRPRSRKRQLMSFVRMWFGHGLFGKLPIPFGDFVPALVIVRLRREFCRHMFGALGLDQIFSEFPLGHVHDSTLVSPN